MTVKFLIIRFSSIGDIVLTTPVIRCLKKQIEGASIHFVTKKKYLPVINQNPYINKIHVLDNDLKSLIKELKEERFDYIIDLHNNLRSFILKARLRNSLIFTYRKLNFQKWLMVVFKKNILPKKHLVDRYFETLKLFEVVNDNEGLDFFIEPKNEINPTSLPLLFHEGYAAIVIGGLHATKQMPAAMVAKICNGFNGPIILLGGNDDRMLAENVIQLTENVRIFNACGGYTIQQSASIVKQAKFVITNDTGLMHIAAAYKQNIISVWGNTIPEFGMYPYLPNQNFYVFEVRNLKCRPCSKLGYNKCPLKHFNCMNKQDIDGIINLSNTLFRKETLR